MSAWRVLAGRQERLGPARAPGRRLVVIGTSGSGKTTLARALAELFGCPHVELDALHWEPGWTPAEDEVFRARVDAALAGECWVVDGVYSQVRDIVWGRADTVVWLDYPFASVMRRLTQRTFGRVARREVLWGTNRETVRGVFLEKDSLFIWVLRTHWSRRPRYRGLLGPGGEYGDKRIVHLRTPREADRWLAAVRRQANMNIYGASVAGNTSRTA